ncbi:glycosyltransferase family 8 protein [Francisella philomiragia]|uniref:glycosyltransferase family 8 protein n=1 Tax=Francisella philomiragia TaxID=28110 RepID=UPI003518580E
MKNLIAFTIDENYIEPFIVAIQSFTLHHNVDKYIIALIHSNIAENKIRKIKKFFQKINLLLVVKKIKNDFEGIKVGYHFNSVIFYRLLLSDIFNDYERILYIDSDIIFLDNIDKLFHLNLKDNVLAAIPKHNYYMIPKHLEGKVQKYFASGLLLINTKKFIDFGISDKCIYFLRNSKYEMPDQDALNVAVDKWLELDLSYGVETAFLESNNDELKIKIQNPKIIQFSGSSKPWHFRNKHPYKHLYWRYLRMTSFKRYIPVDLTVVNIIKWMIPKRIKDVLKRHKIK